MALEAPPPTAFSNALAKEIYTKCRESILFVMFETKDEKKLESALVTLNPKIKEAAKREKCELVRSSTGFVVGESDETIEIATCAHPMDHVYNASTVPSAEELNEMFLITVLCDHQELTFRDNKRTDRKLTEATITQVQVKQDLLLLSVNKKGLLNLQNETCTEEHRPLAPSRYSVPALEAVLMVSWPPSMHRATAIGQVSHGCRDYEDVFDKNTHGYKLKLLEVDIKGIEEAAGAPLLDSQGGYFGMFHGKEKKKELCYFIAYPEIQNFTSASTPSLQNNETTEPNSPSMEAPTPTAFSNALAKEIYDLRKDSVFCLKFSTSDSKLMLQALKTLGNYSSVKKRKEECSKIRYASGFAVGGNSENLQILSCAHSLDHLYTDKKSFPLSYLSSMLEVSVMCDHQEQSFCRKARADRVFAVAKIVQIDFKKDLLLLSVERKRVHNLSDQTCELAHPVVPFSTNVPPQLENVVLLCWPPQMNRTTTLGPISHRCRKFGDVTQSNEHGYTMELTEVDVVCYSGCSGGPLFDSAGDCVGLAHGRGGVGNYSAFVALSEIRGFLSTCPVIAA